MRSYVERRRKYNSSFLFVTKISGVDLQAAGEG